MDGSWNEQQKAAGQLFLRNFLPKGEHIILMEDLPYEFELCLIALLMHHEMQQ